MNTDYIALQLIEFFYAIRRKYTYLETLSFFFFYSSFYPPLLWSSELQVPTRPEDSTQLRLWTGLLSHWFGGWVSQNGISTFTFQNTHSGTDVFYGD